MLVLTRKLDESIVIGNDIVIKVVGVAGNQVHLGITAPREVPIYREEIYDLVRSGNREAVTTPAPGGAPSSSLAGLLRHASTRAEAVEEES